MTKEQYLKTVSTALRRCGMKRSARKRLETDLKSDFSARLERGESAEEIMRSMGAPDELAAEFLKENGGAPAKTPSEKRLLVFGLLSAAVTVFSGFRLSVLQNLINRFHGWLSLQQAGTDGVAVIGGADGPTAIFITARPKPWTAVLFAFTLTACIVCFVLYARSRRKRN